MWKIFPFEKIITGNTEEELPWKYKDFKELLKNIKNIINTIKIEFWKE